MLSEIFYWLLNTSIIGTIVGFIVMVLRKIKALPRFVVYILWVLPLIRLWVPFGIAYKYSLLSFISRYTTKTVVVWESNPSFTASNSLIMVKSYFPIIYKTDLLEAVFNIASIIWIIVCCAAVLTSVLLYFFAKSEMKTAEFIKKNIYKSNRIISPAVYGIIHPKIIIPANVTDEAIDYIVLHEQAHIRRKDNMFRIIALITSCVHWFNPFVWIFLKYLFIDMELACDASVLKNLSQGQTLEYANTIVTYASSKTLFASAFGGAKTKVRIENVLSYKKLTILSTICLAVLIMMIAIIIITNATV